MVFPKSKSGLRATSRANRSRSILDHYRLVATARCRVRKMRAASSCLLKPSDRSKFIDRMNVGTKSGDTPGRSTGSTSPL